MQPAFVPRSLDPMGTGQLPVTLSKRIEGGFSSKNHINAVSIVSDREKFNSRGSRPPSV
jgi:hypothetical protein